MLGFVLAAVDLRAADPEIGRVAIPPGTRFGGTGPPPAPSPLDAMLGPNPNLSTDAACAELVRRIAADIPRDKVPELIAARPDAALLRQRLGAGRAELQNRLMERAVKIANAKLAAERRAPLMRLLSINSGSADDFARDVDITLFGGDKVREKALFDAIEEAARHPDIGLDARVGAGGLKIDALEATFFPSGNDLPDARYAENPAKHIREYREALQKQRAEVEAYKGSGWKLEVYTKRNPETARVMEFTWSPQASAVVRHGYLPENGEELRALLHGAATRRLEKWELASALVSPLLQAKLHGEGGDPTKGPIKYAARSVDAVCAYFDLPAWATLSPDDRAALLARVMPHLDPAQPNGRRLLDKMASALDTARQIRAAKGTNLPAADIARLETLCTGFLSHSVQATMAETAAAMLEPPPLELKKTNFTTEDLERIGRMNAREKHEFLGRKDADYRRCVSTEAMEDLLMAVVELRGLDIDPKTGKETGRTGAIALEQMKRRAPPHLKPVMELAVEYAVVYHCASWARDVKSAADATSRLYAVRAGMRKVMAQSRTPGEDVLEKARRLPPGIFIKQETARPGSALGEAGGRMRQRARLAAEARFPDAITAQRRATTELTSAPPSYLRQRVVDEIFDLGTVSDALTLVEMFQGGASASDYLQFGAENLLGRTHWAAGFFISGLKARSEEDFRRIGNEAFFAAAARFLPGIGQVKAVFDIAQGTLNVTVGYAIQGRNAETVDCLYVGANRTGPVNAPLPGAGTTAQALRESGFSVLGDAHFRVFRPKGEAADQRIVNCAAVYQDFFRRWTSEDWDGLKESGPRGGATTPFLQAHDELATVLLREAGRTGPLWIPAPGRSAADVVAEMLAWRAPSETEYRIAVDAIYPLLEQRCRVAVRKVLEEAGARTYRSVFQSEGEDVIEQQVIQRLAADVLAGMTDAWRQRATEQPLARRQVERAAMGEDIAAIAAAVRQGAFGTAVPPKAPKVELKVAVTGRSIGGTAAAPVAAKAAAPIGPKGSVAATTAAVPVLDGGAPVIVVPELQPLDEKQHTSRLRLERAEEKVTVVARAPNSPNDGKVGPGDRLRTEVVFTARDGEGGPIVGTTRIVYDVVLPEPELEVPNGLPVRRIKTATIEREYIDLSPLYPPGTWKGAWKAPAGWIMESPGEVWHGPNNYLDGNGRVQLSQNFRFGRLHGVEKRMANDGRVEKETTWDNGVVHGKTTIYQLKEAPVKGCPVGGRAVTDYNRGSITGHEVRAADGKVRVRVTAERVTPAEVPPDTTVLYRGLVEESGENGKLKMRCGFVNLSNEDRGRLVQQGLMAAYRMPATTIGGFTIPLPAWYMDGECTFYRDNGDLYRRARYQRGVEAGQEEAWHAPGRLARRGKLEGDRKTGRWEWFHASGRPQAAGTYGSDGIPTGEWVIYGDRDNDPGWKTTGAGIQAGKINPYWVSRQ